MRKAKLWFDRIRDLRSYKLPLGCKSRWKGPQSSLHSAHKFSSKMAPLNMPSTFILHFYFMNLGPKYVIYCPSGAIMGKKEKCDLTGNKHLASEFFLSCSSNWATIHAKKVLNLLHERYYSKFCLLKNLFSFEKKKSIFYKRISLF